MIPSRIGLQGFLCYREPRELAFGETDLWVLAGANGSGKSSVFDAITFALFGQHRGGGQNYADLINQESNALQVEFDFKLDGGLYRARRTVKRRAKGSPQASQQLATWDGAAWQPLPTTETKKGFDQWVQQNVGLDYETFTSSVILLQGKAERLLDSEPRKRFDILARVVDLARYQRLHEKADGERKAIKAQVELLSDQLAAIPGLGDEEVQSLDARIIEADAKAEATVVAVEAARRGVSEAGEWAKLSSRLADQRRRLAEFDASLAGAAATERDHARYQELVAIAPHVTAVIGHRATAAEERRKLDSAREALAKADAGLAETDATLKQARAKRASLDTRLLALDTQIERGNATLRDLSQRVGLLGVLEKAQAERGRAERDAAAFPADLPAKLTAADAAMREAQLYRDLAPRVEPLVTLAAEVAQLRRDAAAATQRDAEVRAAGEKLKQQHASKQAEFAEVAGRVTLFEGKAAGERSLLEQARQGIREFEEMEGAKVCRHCAQALTPAHFKTELRNRKAGVLATQGSLHRYEAELETQVPIHRALKTRLDELAGELGEKRSEFAANKRDVEWLDKAVREGVARLDRLTAAWDAAVPDGERERLRAARLAADAGLAADVAKRAAGFDAAARERQRLAEQADARRAAEARLTQHAAAVADAERAIGEPAADLRAKHAKAELDVTTATKERMTQRQLQQDTQLEIERLGKGRDAWQAQRTDMAAAAQKHEQTGLHADQMAAAALKLIPAGWRERVEKAKLSDQHAVEGERIELERGGIVARHTALQAARQQRGGVEHAVAEVEAEAATIPPPSRRPVPLAELDLKAAQAAHADADKAQRLAHRERDAQRETIAKRATLANQLRDREREYRDAETLAKLLGRDRLQLALVRRAERQIVEYANQVLDRLTGGLLALRLCQLDAESGDTKALDLEALNRETGQAPMGVAFLSGSQRFRVAVALALAIGQYAGKQHRPIEAVVIDEGFGCLDRASRQTMVQELQNLRGMLQCILLVSHQEEFADAFPHGYRFELDGGSTRIERLQR